MAYIFNLLNMVQLVTLQLFSTTKNYNSFKNTIEKTSLSIQFTFQV